MNAQKFFVNDNLTANKVKRCFDDNIIFQNALAEWLVENKQQCISWNGFMEAIIKTCELVSDEHEEYENQVIDGVNDIVNTLLERGFLSPYIYVPLTLKIKIEDMI